MRDRNLRLLNVQSESEFPHLFLDLSDSEDDESSSCTKIIGDQNNANIKESESFPISECGYVPIKCKILSDLFKSKFNTKESRIEQIVGKCRALKKQTKFDTKSNSNAQFRKNHRKLKIIDGQQITANSERETVLNQTNTACELENFCENLEELRQNASSTWKMTTASPTLSTKPHSEGLLLLWDLPKSFDHSIVQVYLVFAQEINQTWVNIGNVKPLRLPMGCRLNGLERGKIYNFKIQPVFADNIPGLFSNQCSSETTENSI